MAISRLGRTWTRSLVAILGQSGIRVRSPFPSRISGVLEKSARLSSSSLP